MVFNHGGTETMVVEVNDELDNLVALPGGTLYDIYDTEGNMEQQNQAAVVSGLQAQCLINTVTLGVGDYDLFLKFTAGADSPRLGPHRFRIN